MSAVLTSKPNAPPRVAPSIDKGRLAKTKLILLRGKTSRYLRYLHFRNYLEKVAGEVESVCVCGAGSGFAEVAAAIEFPHINFTLTDVIAGNYPSYHRAMDFAWRCGIDNLSFSVWNVLSPTKRRFDMVASTEMLEHIEDDASAAKNMRDAARKYVYCLVPFAEASRNADPIARKRAWDHCEHHVCGYDAARLQELFGEPVAMAGTYWATRGAAFRAKLQALSQEEIDLQAEALIDEAALDDTGALPSASSRAVGIKILARA